MEKRESAYIDSEKNIWNDINMDLFMRQASEQRMDMLFKRVNNLEENFKKLSWDFSDRIEKNNKRDEKIQKTEQAQAEKEELTFDESEYQEILIRCLEVIDEIRDNNDLRIQIQYVTILIKKIDKMRNLNSVKENVDKKKKFAFMRLLLKMNSDSFLLSKEQIDLLRHAFSDIEEEENARDYVKKYTVAFMDVGLSTMPSWE